MNKSKEIIPFFKPDIGDDEIKEVVHSLKMGWVTTGIKTKEFEDDFSAYLGKTADKLFSIAVNSATSGLHLALEAVGIKAGDEVIVPDFTFTASAEVIRYLGADPVFVDADEKTFNITPSQVEACITPRTRAIIVVHFAGLAVDMDGIIALAQKYDLKVIEDAAHALPATYKGQMVGTLKSDATVFSFYATKTITTGEGGMLVTRHSEIAERCKVMRLHGIDRDAFDRYTSNKASWKYDVIAPGYKYNMTDIAASLGIHQLRKATNYRSQRVAIAQKYSDLLSDLPLILPTDAPENEIHAWHLYVVRISENSSWKRDELIDALNEEGIKCSVHFIPLHRLKFWQEHYHLKATDFPVAEKIFQSCVSLPLFPSMTDEQVERVAKTLIKLLS